MVGLGGCSSVEVGNRGSGSSAPAAFEIVMMSFGGCSLEE